MPKAIGKNSKVFVAGHRGLLGSAMIRRLRFHGYNNLVTAAREELDLREKSAVAKFMTMTKPDVVVDCAAVVGGIHANMSRPAEFIQDNLLIQTSLIDGAHRAGVEHFVFVGSNCNYPKGCHQPMGEDLLLTGAPEPTNAPYAAAKLSGLVQCRAYAQQFGRRYFSVVPASLYGPNDNFHPEDSHVLPALILKFHSAIRHKKKEVNFWGTGIARRELMFSDDAADGIILCLEKYTELDPINIGVGSDLTVREIGEILKSILGFSGEITFDSSKPDGNLQKLLNSSKVNQLGFIPKNSLSEGLAKTYSWFVEAAKVRGINEGENRRES